MVPESVSKERLKHRGREDDAPAVLDQRFELYEQDIAPVIGFFERAGIPIHPVDGNRSIEAVFKDMDRILRDVHQG
jgi:adenylate kinase family enzyme